MKSTIKNPHRINKWIFAIACVGVAIALFSEKMHQATSTCIQKQKVVKILSVTPEVITVEVDSGSMQELKQGSIKLNDEVCVKYNY